MAHFPDASCDLCVRRTISAPVSALLILLTSIGAAFAPTIRAESPKAVPRQELVPNTGTPAADVAGQGPTTVVNAGSGFKAGTVQANGSAKLVGSAIQLTDGGQDEAGSFFTPTVVDVRGFVTDFDFQMQNAQADGMTFTIQNVNPYALGGTGGSLGYAGIPRSLAIKFDIYDEADPYDSSTGIYTEGAPPTQPSLGFTGRTTGSNPYFQGGDVFHVHMVYTNYNQLTVTITDPSTGAFAQNVYTIDIPSTIYGTAGYVGFTGATGALTAVQSVLDWTYSPLPNYELIQGPAPQTTYPFITDQGLVLNGGAHVIENYHALRLLDSGTAGEARSAYFSTPVNVQNFVTDFRFQASDAIGDGFTFVLQNSGLGAVGPSGGGLGYGPDTPYGSASSGIAKSVAVKFDFYSNAGEGDDSTGLYINGASPTLPSIDLSGTGIVLTNGDVFDAHMTYDGATLTVMITDTNTGATATQSYPVNIPSIVGGSTAYAGFTGGTGSLSATENILDWTFAPQP